MDDGNQVLVQDPMFHLFTVSSMIQGGRELS